jgi:hypothetical protein
VDIAKLLQERIQAAIDAAGGTDADGGEDNADASRARASAAGGGGTNIAFSANIGRSGSSSSVYSDDDVTIIQRDGHTEVIHKPGNKPSPDPDRP